MNIRDHIAENLLLVKRERERERERERLILLCPQKPGQVAIQICVTPPKAGYLFNLHHGSNTRLRARPVILSKRQSSCLAKKTEAAKRRDAMK